MDDFTNFIAAKVAAIANTAKVKPMSVSIAYQQTDDAEPMPWVVRIAVFKRGRRNAHDSGFGFGATIDDAAAMAIEDVAKWIAVGYERSEPA